MTRITIKRPRIIWLKTKILTIRKTWDLIIKSSYREGNRIEKETRIWLKNTTKRDLKKIINRR